MARWLVTVKVTASGDLKLEVEAPDRRRAEIAAEEEAEYRHLFFGDWDHIEYDMVGCERMPDEKTASTDEQRING